jgi:cobalt transporter subunit CbtA
MIARALLAAIFVGLFSGLIATGVQHWRVVPLIIAAEAYEGVAPHDHGAHDHGALERPASALPQLAAALALVQPAMAHGESLDDVGPLGLGRLGGTILANMITGTGFALLLLAVSVIGGKPLTLGNAAIWGACGWLALHFLPAIGLPPELPGFPAADLQARQLWWVACVGLSAAGLWMLLVLQKPYQKLGGAAALAIPHVVGAPQPADIASAVPALLAAEYAIAALVASLILWMVLAHLLAFALRRIGFDRDLELAA